MHTRSDAFPVPTTPFRRVAAAALWSLALLAAGCDSGNDGGTPMARASIGADGGRLDVDDGDFAGLSLLVPPRAVDRGVEFTADGAFATAVPGFTIIGRAVRLGPDVDFDLPAVLTLPFDPAALSGQPRPVVFCRTNDGDLLELEPDPLVTGTPLVTVAIRQLGTFWAGERGNLSQEQYVTTVDYLPLDNGNVWNLTDGLTIAAATSTNEPNLPFVQVSRLSFTLPDREFGFYLQTDFQTGTTDFVGHYERAGEAGFQLLHQAATWLPAEVTSGQRAEHLRRFDGYEPYGVTAANFEGIAWTTFDATVTGTQETLVEVIDNQGQPALLSFDETVRFRFVLHYRDHDGGALRRAFEVTCARFVGPIAAVVDGVEHRLDSGVVAGTPIGD
jgi:hypothetical protein